MIVIVDPDAYFRNRSCAEDGWNLLQTKAPYKRDYLLAAPSWNYKGLQCKERRYDTAFTVQTRLLGSLCYRVSRLFNFSFTHFWSPHSGRKLLPTAASVLGAPTQDKNLLGGWSAEGSERHNRLAKYKIAQIQRDLIQRGSDEVIPPLRPRGRTGVFHRQRHHRLSQSSGAPSRWSSATVLSDGHRERLETCWTAG